jgi:hypothetical protein
VLHAGTILGIFGISNVSRDLEQLALSVGKDPVEVERVLEASLPRLREEVSRTGPFHWSSEVIAR